MTPSCLSLRRRSWGRWKRLTEAQGTSNTGQKRSPTRRETGLNGKFTCVERPTESRKMEGAMCDGRETVLEY